MFSMRKLEEGKMTVEAAFVVPFTISILALILFFFFYCYESGVAAGLIQEELTIPNLVETYTDCQADMKKKMAVRSVFGKEVKITVKKSGETISVDISSEMPVFRIAQHGKSVLRKPAEKMRRWQQLE